MDLCGVFNPNRCGQSCPVQGKVGIRHAVTTQGSDEIRHTITTQDTPFSLKVADGGDRLPRVDLI